MRTKIEIDSDRLQALERAISDVRDAWASCPMSGEGGAPIHTRATFGGWILKHLFSVLSVALWAATMIGMSGGWIRIQERSDVDIQKKQTELSDAFHNHQVTDDLIYARKDVLLEQFNKIEFEIKTLNDRLVYERRLKGTP
jgi:hypothetical protein